MAKKSVATLQTGSGKVYTKCVKMMKSEKGSYTFKQEIVHNDKIKAFFEKK
jgi:hypothetical protein